MVGHDIAVGDFIAIPSWCTAGMVMAITWPTNGDARATVLLQEHPEQDARDWRTYRLDRSDYLTEWQS